MKVEDCFHFGKVIKTHGLKGAVSVRFDVDDCSEYLDLKYILLDIHRKLVPFFIKGKIEVSNKGIARIELDDVTTEAQGRALVGLTAYLPLTMLPELTEEQYYLHDLPGYKVTDKHKGLIGIVGCVIESNTQPLLQVLDGETEILIPLIEDIVYRVDKKNQEVFTDCPDGLIELYTD